LIAEGTHFETNELSFRQIGRKALAVNLSDLAAMGATPTAATFSLLLTRGPNTPQQAVEITEGGAELAQQFNVDIVGGDTNVWNGPLVVSVTALGTVPIGSAWLRSGARPGDSIIVTGELGGSRGQHHYGFTPRIEAAIALRRDYTVHAAMDISDGLGLDLFRMAHASGVGADLDAAQIPISRAAHAVSQRDQHSPIEHALQDGEDFELLLAMPAESADRLLHDANFPVRCTRIGRFSEELGLWKTTPEGRVALIPQGYLHR